MEIVKISFINMNIWSNLLRTLIIINNYFVIKNTQKKQNGYDDSN